MAASIFQSPAQRDQLIGGIGNLPFTLAQGFIDHSFVVVHTHCTLHIRQSVIYIIRGICRFPTFRLIGCQQSGMQFILHSDALTGDLGCQHLVQGSQCLLAAVVAAVLLHKTAHTGGIDIKIQICFTLFIVSNIAADDITFTDGSNLYLHAGVCRLKAFL